LQFKNIGDGVTREILKEVFGTISTVQFADFAKGQTEGILRFADAEAAQKALKEMTEKKTPLGDKVPELSILEHEEEEKYKSKLFDSMRNSLKKRSGGKKNFKRRK